MFPGTASDGYYHIQTWRNCVNATPRVDTGSQAQIAAVVMNIVDVGCRARKIVIDKSSGDAVVPPFGRNIIGTFCNMAACGMLKTSR